MKALRYALYVVAGLAALLALAVAAVAVFVDGAFVKTRLEGAMQARHRTLKIEGVPALTLFPVAGISLGKTTLSEPNSDKPFVSFDSAQVAVRVMPLLSSEIAVEKLRISGLEAHLVRRKDGSMNYSDLAGGGEAHGGAAAPRLRLAEVLVEHANLAYRDEASGQEIDVKDLNLKTGRLEGGTPGQVALEMRVTGRRPDLDLHARASGAMRFDLGRSEFAFDGFEAALAGKVEQDTLAAQFSAPKVEVTPARAAGSEVRGKVELKGPHRKVDASLRIAAVEGSASALTIPAIELDLDAAVDRIATRAKLRAALKANLEKQDLDAEASGKLDDSSLKAGVHVKNFAPLAATFDVSADRLDLDRYLGPAPKEKQGDERIDLGALRGKTVSGRVAIGALVARRVKLQDVKAELRLAGGKLEVSPWSAKLYGGTASGTLTAEADGNRFHVKETAQNVALGELLRDAARKDVLEGRGDVSADVRCAGATVPALKRSLNGSARVYLKDGAIKGVNLADSARNLKSAVGIKQGKADLSKKTDFSELSASFDIKNGVARNDDLKAASPFLRLGGSGDLDLGADTIDYLAKATLVATAKGQGGRAAGDVAGVTIPVKLSGALESPDWHIDYTGLVGGAAGGVVQGAEKGVSSLKNAVRGLFGR
ncbi:MAG TPA: AsmA family protein [Burkholderiales bacterium]|nr:AsmA family protein [Burkholderiales bacterium]